MPYALHIMCLFIFMSVVCVCILEMHRYSADNRYQLVRLVCWYRPIVIYTIGNTSFIFITKSQQTGEWLPFPIKVGVFCNIFLGCFFVLSALCGPSSK